MSVLERDLLAVEYAEALEEFLRDGGEAALHRGYELGRAAIEHGWGVLDAAAAHHRALARALPAGTPAQTSERTLALGGAFFSECMSSFEMAQRGFAESLAAVRSQAAELADVNAKLRGEIAERRQAEEELRAIGSVLENALEGISRVGADGRYASVNSAFARMLGWTPAELAGRDWRESFHPVDRRRLENAGRGLAAAGKAAAEVRAVRKDGSLLHARVVLIRDASGLHCFVSDETERKRAEAERARRLAESARAEALARSNDELQQFASVVAHDLQEPLRTVSSYMKLLLERLRGGDAQTREYSLRAAQGARRMSRLISDLLAYTRVDSQGRAFEPTDCDAALAGALANLHAAIAESGARVERERLPVVTADPFQMIELFQNLIANSIRFRGPETPRVAVSARRTGRAWTFTVRDNGVGFDPREAGRLFELFRRLDPSLPGHGIGLAVCRKIVERHGGRIWAESEKGGGAAFHFSLPDRARARAAPEAAARGTNR